MLPTERLKFAQHQLEILDEELLAVEGTLNGYDFRAKFEKCKDALRLLYYDHGYSSRSEAVNHFLNDPEIQAWIREGNG